MDLYLGPEETMSLYGIKTDGLYYVRDGMVNKYAMTFQHQVRGQFYGILCPSFRPQIRLIFFYLYIIQIILKSKDTSLVGGISYAKKADYFRNERERGRRERREEELETKNFIKGFISLPLN